MPENITHQLVIYGSEMEKPYVIPMAEAGSAIIGRQAGSDLVIDHPLVSRRHARLEGSIDGYKIIDLDSANGVLVNGNEIVPLQAVPLHPGDVIEIGPYRIVYGQNIEESNIDEIQNPYDAYSEGESIPPPPNGESLPTASLEEPEYEPPPGLTFTHSRYIRYLPEIYHTDFMRRFLAMIESFVIPIEWNIYNFDLYLDPKTAPNFFLPWLSQWYEILFDDTWGESQRRELLLESPQIYARRGTRWALERVLEIYLGVKPEIDDQSSELAPYTFTVVIPKTDTLYRRSLIEHILDINKPAHVTYALTFQTS